MVILADDLPTLNPSPTCDSRTVHALHIFLERVAGFLSGHLNFFAKDSVLEPLRLGTNVRNFFANRFLFTLLALLPSNEQDHGISVAVRQRHAGLLTVVRHGEIEKVGGPARV